MNAQTKTARKVCPEPPPDETWWRIYLADRRSVLETMRANLAADLMAGYDPDGASIQRQRKAINDYAADLRAHLYTMLFWPHDVKESWCYFDLLERGAISA